LIKKIEGIIISEVDYKESSKIINVFTKEYGIIGLIATGAKKLKSPLSGVTTKLTFGNFHIYYKENGLSKLIEVDVINNFKSIRGDILKISCASFLAELSTQVYRQSMTSEIYNLFIESLLKIEDNFDPEVITNILELKLLDYLGIRPVVDKCVNCNSTNNIVTISSYRGGYICKNCLTNEKILDSKTVKLIRMFYYVDISKISTLDISEKVKQELNEFIDLYYDRYAGLYLKSKEFLKELKKIS